MTDTITMEDFRKLVDSFPELDHYLVPSSFEDAAKRDGIILPNNIHVSPYCPGDAAYKVSGDYYRRMTSFTQPQYFFKPEIEITSPLPADTFFNTHMHDLSNAIGVMIPDVTDLGVSMNQIRTMIHVMVRHHYVPGRKRRGGISRRKMSK